MVDNARIENQLQAIEKAARTLPTSLQEEDIAKLRGWSENVLKLQSEVAAAMGKLYEIGDYSSKESVILHKLSSRLEPVVEHAKTLDSSFEDLDAVNSMAADEQDVELLKMAEEESQSLVESIKEQAVSINAKFIAVEEADRPVYIEIRAGAGGEEASIFASELMRMYMRYAERVGARCDVVKTSESDHGLKQVWIHADSGYIKLQYEAGIHRVQRVPKTESTGRVHTSTCTVAILEDPEGVDEITIDHDDLRIDKYRASGAGGQHVNKTDSAVRVTHLPTGLVVQCQQDRSQHMNLETAMKLLRAQLADMERKKLEQERSDLRKNMVGTGDRSGKIRTYNFPQSRVTDHRVNYTTNNLKEFLDGDLFELTKLLIRQEDEE